MLSISSGHSSEYLTSAVGAGRESYYTGAVTEGEPPGVWHGRGAEALGLEGEVDAEVMHAIYERFADPSDPRFADPATRHEADTLGRAPKKYRSVDEVVSARVEAYSKETASTPSPEQVRDWRIEAEASAPKAVMFHDVTYSPVKSVTVAHAAFSRAASEAQAAGDVDAAAEWGRRVAAIDAGVAAANAAMLDYVAAHAGYARTGRHGARSVAGKWVDAHGLTAATFYQHTSRDLDPQLHMHNAILNRVQCPDGQWRSIDSKALYASLHGAAAVASSVLREELSRGLGFEWVIREDGHDFEVAGVDQDVMDLFSSRRASTTRRADELIAAAEERVGRPLNGLERTRLQQQAALGTRRAKTHEGESLDERLDRWHAELSGEVVGGLTGQANRLAARTDTATSSARPGEDVAWSESAVIAAAVEACHGEGGRSTFGRHELLRQIDLALPPALGLDAAERVELLERLTDTALQVEGLVVQTAGQEIGTAPADARRADGTAEAVAPHAVRYAAAGHLAAEGALLRRAGQRGRTCLPAPVVRDWLDRNGAGLTEAQRAAVAGLAASDAATAVLVGPAGTGKSYTAGVLASLWAEAHQETGGRVLGLATAQAAANVLTEDGVPQATNVAAFLTAQNRLRDGRPMDGDHAWRLTPNDVVVVDEASMLDTDHLTRVHEAVDAAGARLVLMGDPHQLGPVGAGGLMRTLVERQAETYTLTDVRRFHAEWERDASLKLRDGDPDAVADYRRHGRLIDAGTEADAIAGIARAAAADRIAGHTTVVVTATNEHASRVSAAVRGHLVDDGVVRDDAGVVLGRDGTTAGVGDLVQARRIDRTLGLVNRDTYEVTAVREDGGLDVVSTRTGEQLLMPAGYVAEDASLAYASTAHAAQGATVDRGHVLLIPNLDRAGAYVGLTRGRESNTAWAITHTPPRPNDVAEGEREPQTAAGILTRTVTAETDPGRADLSALDVTALDEARRANAGTLLGLIEDETRIASRQRLEHHLDTLTADGALSERDRARLGADQGTEHLARLLRVHEQAGHDPAELLRGALANGRGLDSANSVAQVLSARIQATHDLPAPAPTGAAEGAPALDGDPARAGYLTDLRQLLDDRSRDLGSQLADTLDHRAAAEPASDTAQAAAGTAAGEWLACLGPIPVDDSARGEWIERAGVIAAYREASGWNHSEQPFGRCPGVSTPEKRAMWQDAYAAAGMPETRRPEAEMTDGRLLVRLTAAERAEASLPAYVEDALAAQHARAAEAERAAVLARAADRAEDADRHGEAAQAARDAVERLALIHEARAERLAATIETREAGRAAREELTRRGHTPGHEPDRTTAEEWLALDRAARQADDAHRDITETDLDHTHELDDHRDSPSASAPADTDTNERRALPAQNTTAAADERRMEPRGVDTDTGSDTEAEPPRQRRPTEQVPASAGSAEIAAALAHAEAAGEQAARERVQDASEPADLAAAGRDDDYEWLRQQRAAEEAAGTAAVGDGLTA